MRPSIWHALFTATLLLPGCGGAGEAPKGAAAHPEPRSAAVSTPIPAPAPSSAKEACARPGVHFPDAKYAPRPLTPAEEQRVAEMDGYVRDHPSPAGPRGKADLAEHEYARARAFFEANRWAEAAVGFRAVAVSHPDTDFGVHAAMLYLESLNVLGSRAEPERPQCFEEMERDVPILLELYCVGQQAKQNVEPCAVLHKIQRDVDRLSAQKLVAEADQGEGDSSGRYGEAGEKYLALARRCCAEVRLAGGSTQAERCDEIAYNAGRAFLAAHRPERAREAHGILLDPRNGMQKSPLTTKLGEILQRLPAPP